MGENELLKFLRKSFGVGGDDYLEVCLAVDQLGVLPFRATEALVYQGRVPPAEAALTRLSDKLVSTIRMTAPKAVLGVIDGASGRSRFFVAARTQRPWEWFRASPDFRLLSVADGDSWLVVSRLAGYGRIVV